MNADYYICAFYGYMAMCVCVCVVEVLNDSNAVSGRAVVIYNEGVSR